MSTAKGKRLTATTLVFLVTFGVSSCSLLGNVDTRLCEEAVKKRLKAPATSVFFGFEQEEMDGRLTAVRGQVDSENSFGAMIRSSFKCHVLDDKDATVMYID